MASHETTFMKVAIEGCCHGELDNIYATIEQAGKQTGAPPPDVLICCGDFQAFRNRSDLNTFAAPPKYRQMGDFWKYYKGEKVAPVLTIFIGGNHEASGYLWELFHGGWAAPNIFYLGMAGSVILKKTFPDGRSHKIRISGASGIYKRHDYWTGHHERLPYDNSTIRSIYHIREYDVFRLKQLPINPCDIFVSHDWPVGIEQFGNTGQLIRAKPFFRDEIASNTLGSPPLMEILQAVRPSFWFSAHLHVKFSALVRHDRPIASSDQTQVQTDDHLNANPDELKIDLNDSDTEPTRFSGQNKDVQDASNPDQILIDDASEEEEDVVGQAPPTETNLCVSEKSQTPAPNPDQLTVAQSNVELANSSVHRSTPPNTLVDQTLNDLNEVEAKGMDQTKNSTVHAVKLSSNSDKITRFLALDKCMPRKDFLQIIDIPLDESNLDVSESIPSASSSNPNQPEDLNRHTQSTIPDPTPQAEPTITDPPGHPTVTLHFDPHWLAITRAFHSDLPLFKHHNSKLPNDPLQVQEMIEAELRWVNDQIGGTGLKIEDVQQFTQTAPALGEPGGDDPGQPFWYTNPQTVGFANFLGIENKINPQPDVVGPGQD